MGKGKIQKFAETATFQNVLQPSFHETFQRGYSLKGKWNTDIFKNQNPITLELGCGKGEYSIGLAKRFPNRNFIGMDIKGARIWRGAKTALEEKLTNIIFLRTRIEFINSFFTNDEINEIWIPFPDPQPKKAKNRLTSGKFLNKYRNLLVHNGHIHLKTDNQMLYEYTRQLIEYNQLPLLYATNNLYMNSVEDELAIQTFYEKQFLEQYIPISYLRFTLPKTKTIHEVPKE